MSTLTNEEQNHSIQRFPETSPQDTRRGARRDDGRRSFLKYGGATLATASLLMTGCEEFDDFIGNPASKAINLGSGDIGILNYAYTLEQLEARFYSIVVQSRCGLSEEESRIIGDLYEHEVIHREFYKAVLGKDAIPELAFDFSAIDFTSRESVLGAAKTFEDLGVAAYNGAGQLLKSKDLLLIAGKIVSVEARHAAAIRDVFDTDPTSFAGDDVIDENGLDRAFSTATVLEAAAQYIVNEIDGSHLPTA